MGACASCVSEQQSACAPATSLAILQKGVLGKSASSSERRTLEFGALEVAEQLGAGQFCDVFSATLRGTGQHLAVKVSLPRTRTHASAMQAPTRVQFLLNKLAC